MNDSLIFGIAMTWLYVGLTLMGVPYMEYAVIFWIGFSARAIFD